MTRPNIVVCLCRQNGLEQETLLVFLSDHGDMLGSHHLYNMHKDRCEITDVAAQHPEVVEDLNAQWHVIAKRLGARRTGRTQGKRRK